MDATRATTLQTLSEFRRKAIVIAGEAVESKKSGSFDGLIAEFKDFLDSFDRNMHEEITIEMLEVVGQISMQMDSSSNLAFKNMLGAAIVPKSGHVPPWDVQWRMQRERLAMAFLGAMDRTFVVNHSVDRLVNSYSPSEIALIFKSNIPKKAVPTILARKFFKEIRSVQTNDYAFLFDLIAKELDGLNSHERQKVAQHFMKELGLFLKDGFQINGRDAHYSPAQLLTAFFGEDMLREPDFNSAIIESLLTRMSTQEFARLSRYNLSSGQSPESIYADQTVSDLIGAVGLTLESALPVLRHSKTGRV